jgi:Tfp pilus assembly protein PilN
MIEINLVPLSERKKSTTALHLDIPREVLIGVGGVGLLLLVLVHSLLFVQLGIKGAVLATQNSEWQKILPEKNNIDGLGTQIKDFKKKMSTITDVTSKKAMDWSRKLNTISDAIPKGLWLTRISLESSLLIEGSVVSKNQNEIMIVGNFVSNLKSDAAFMKNFEGLEVNSIKRTKQGTTEIANFTVTGKLK